MSFTVLSVLIIAVLALCLVIEIYRAVRGGARKAFVSLGSIVFSIVLSALLSPLLSSLAVKLAVLIFGESVMNELGELRAMVEPMLAIAVSILIFIGVFFLVRITVGIVVKIVYAARLRKGDDELDSQSKERSWLERNGRPVSVLVGCASACLVMLAVTSPLLGILYTANDALDLANSANSEMFEDDVLEEIKEGVDKYSEDVPARIVYGMGGKLIYRSYASTFREGERIDLVAELEVLEEATENLLVMLPVMRGEAVAEQKHLESIDVLCDCVNEMKIGRILLATYVPEGAKAWLDGKVIFGIEKPMITPLIEPTFNEMLKACAASEEYNVQQNTVTLLRVYGIFLETKVLDIPADADFYEVLTFLESAGIIDKLSLELERNPYMSNVKKTAEDMAFDVIADEVNTLEFGQLAYDKLMGDLADSINTVNLKGYGTDEERQAVMTMLTKQYISEYGLNVSDEIAGYAASAFLQSFGDSVDDVTTEDIQNFFNEYTN